MTLFLLAVAWFLFGASRAVAWIPFDRWRYSVSWIPPVYGASYVVGGIFLFLLVCAFWPLYWIVRRRALLEKRRH